MFKILVAPLASAISAKCPPSGTKWREHIALWSKQSAYWNPLECNGARQVVAFALRPTIVLCCRITLLTYVLSIRITFGPQLWVEHGSKPPVVLPFLLRRLFFFRIGQHKLIGSGHLSISHHLLMEQHHHSNIIKSLRHIKIVNIYCSRHIRCAVVFLQ